MNRILTVNGRSVKCYSIELSDVDIQDAPEFLNVTILGAYCKSEKGEMVNLNDEELKSIPHREIYNLIFSGY